MKFHINVPGIHPSSVVIWLLVAIVMLHFVVTAFLLNGLRNNHNEKWLALGSPTLFLNNNIRNNFLVLRFIWSGQAVALGDRTVIALVWAARATLMAFLLLIAACYFAENSGISRLV